MSVTIATVGSDTHPGIYSNSRRLGRCNNGVLWALLSDITQGRLEFHYSTNNGSSWSEDTSQRINNVNIGSGASMRIIGDGASSERIAVIYHESGDNHMMCALGYFRSSSRTAFSWHPGSPKFASKGRSSSNYKRPDIEGYYDGQNWLMPSVWGERYSSTNKGLVWMGRNRGFPNELYADTASAIHEQFSVSNAPYPSASLRHLSDSSAVYTASPDLYVSWHQGLDTDPDDSQYMMRLTKSGTTWQTGQVREVVDEGVQSGLVASCFTGQRAAFVAVPSGDTDAINLSLMQPSDSSRESIAVPSLSLGEITSLSVTWDNYNSDIWILAAGTSNTRPHYIVYTWATRSWGSWTQVNTDSVMPDTLTARPGSGGSRIECMYTVDLGSSLAFRYELVGLTNVAPSAPTWAISSGAYDINSSLGLDWNFNDADGDTQAQYRLRRQIDGGSYTYWNGTGWQSSSVNLSSATTLVTLSSGWGTDGSTYEFVVATSDGQVWSVNSATLTVVASIAVNPSITAPAAGPIAEPNVTVTWTVSEQAAWRIRVLDQGTGVQEFTTGWRGESTRRLYQVPYALTDGASYTIELTTQNNEGLASTPQTVDISVALTTAPVPVPTLSTSALTGTITVDIDNGTPGGGEVAAVANNIWRQDLDDSAALPVLVGGPVAADGSFTDRTVRSGRNYSYAVEAITESGAATISSYVSS